MLIPLLILITSSGYGDTSPSIVGYYYYKSARIMEVGLDGRQAFTRMWGEDNSASPTLANERDTALPRPLHRGRLLNNQTVEFADFEMTADDLRRYFGMDDVAGTNTAEQTPPLFPPMEGTRFYERWHVTGSGELLVECALPSCHPLLDERAYSQAEQARANIQKGRAPFADLFGEYRQVCGWRIHRVEELDAWQRLDQGDYLNAAAIFAALTEADSIHPFPWIGLAQALTGASRFDSARLAIAKAKALTTPALRPFLEASIRLVEDQIQTYESLAKGWDFPLLLNLLEETTPEIRLPSLANKNVSEWTAEDLWLAQAIVDQFKHWDVIRKAMEIRGRGPRLPIGQKTFNPDIRSQINRRATLGVPQDLAQLCRLAAALAMRSTPPDPQRAAVYYSMAAHIGQNLRHGALTVQLVGSGIELTALEGLEFLVESGAFKSAGDWETARYVIQKHFIRESALTPLDALCYEALATPASAEPFFTVVYQLFSAINPESTQRMSQSLLTRWALLQSAGNVMDSIQKESALAYPETMPERLLPMDPFAPQTRLRYRQGPNGGAMIYSVGPDGRDDGGQKVIMGLPARGAEGDLVLRLP